MARREPRLARAGQRRAAFHAVGLGHRRRPQHGAHWGGGARGARAVRHGCDGPPAAPHPGSLPSHTAARRLWACAWPSSCARTLARAASTFGPSPWLRTSECSRSRPRHPSQQACSSRGRAAEGPCAPLLGAPLQVAHVCLLHGGLAEPAGPPHLHRLAGVRAQHQHRLTGAWAAGPGQVVDATCSRRGNATPRVRGTTSPLTCGVRAHCS